MCLVFLPRMQREIGKEETAKNAGETRKGPLEGKGTGVLAGPIDSRNLGVGLFGKKCVML